ncbi:MAG: SH3 domain-containing protein [Paracoccaceae bacterium]
MIILRALLFLALSATVASAQSFPWVYNVTGVAEDDRLNIRAAPDGDSAILGDYYAYAVNIEVLETTPDGRWGKVGADGRNGWVAMRFLDRQPDDFPHEFPRPMVCSGTEPFWTLGGYLRGNSYSEPERTSENLTMIQQGRAGMEGAYAIFEEGPTLNHHLIVKRGACNDGMSDRDFGWQAMLFTEAPDGNSVKSGCCSMDTN